MKNLIVVLLATLPFLGLESCCKDGLFAGKDQLPPETTTGANTAGCLVNGEVFIPHQAGLSPSLVCNYEFINGESFFNLHFSDLRGGNIKTVSVRTSKIILTVNNTYLLNIENTIYQPSFIGGGVYMVLMRVIITTPT